MPYLAKFPKSKPISKPKQYKCRQDIYKSRQWLNLRKSKLQLQPLCEMCLQLGKITPAVDIHHIDSFLNYQGTERLAVAYNFNNLMSVCKRCHGLLHKNGTTHG